MEVSRDVSCMVRSWLQASPMASSKVFVRGRDNGTASLFTPRPERLGLGASLPSNHEELARKKMVALRIQRKITGKKRMGNNGEQPGGCSAGAVDVSDNECSKVASVSSRKNLQANLLPQSKKRRRRKRHVESTTNAENTSGMRCALLRTPEKRALLLGGSQSQGPVELAATEEPPLRPDHGVNGLDRPLSSPRPPTSSSGPETTPHRLGELPGNHKRIPASPKSSGLVVEQTTPVGSSLPHCDSDFTETAMTSHTEAAAPAPAGSPPDRPTHPRQSGRRFTDPLLGTATESGTCTRGNWSRCDSLVTRHRKQINKRNGWRKFRTYRSLAKYLAVKQKARHPALYQCSAVLSC